MIDSPFDDAIAQGGALAVDWLARDTAARLVVDRDLRILWQNEAAQSALENGAAVQEENGFLQFRDALGSELWRTAFESIDDNFRRMVVHDVEGHPNMIIGAFSPRGRSSVFLTIVPVSARFDLFGCGMADRFQLTKSELQVAQFLVDLESPKEIAEMLGISITTVRTHIRRLYGKLSVRSQRELLRLTMSYCMA